MQTRPVMSPFFVEVDKLYVTRHSMRESIRAFFLQSKFTESMTCRHPWRLQHLMTNIVYSLKPFQFFKATFWFIGMFKIKFEQQSFEQFEQPALDTTTAFKNYTPLTSPKSGFRDWLGKASHREKSRLGVTGWSKRAHNLKQKFTRSDTAHEILVKRTSYQFDKLYVCFILLKVMCSFNFWGSTGIKVIIL